MDMCPRRAVESSALDFELGFTRVTGLDCSALLARRGFEVAEREGFEPPEACTTMVFKTIAIDHSAISPRGHGFYRYDEAVLRIDLPGELVEAVAPRPVKGDAGLFDPHAGLHEPRTDLDEPVRIGDCNYH